MDIILIAGLWLDGSAWDAVAPELARLGHRPVPLTLPGQGDGRADATLSDQLDAVVAAVDAAAGPCVVVGHSAAATLAWLAADRRPEKVAKVVLIGGFPAAEGEAYAAFFEPADGVVPFPGWAPFEGPDSADLTPERRQAIADAAIPVPAGVALAKIAYTHEDRHAATPVVLLCPEFSPEEALGWIEEGDIAELEDVEDLELVDLDSGHWPMFSRPVDLAELIAQAATPAE